MSEHIEVTVPYGGESRWCLAESMSFRCTRRMGHQGRHAAGYPIEGWKGVWHVAHVWGTDTHREARERGRAALTAKANGRIMQVIDLIAEGAEPDDAWATVEAWAGEPS
ncbi:MAG: hypothetical protein HOQ21_14450 [Dermatophilaceae bacterium]|nr:hypothetical protein [Dermatophilaceae bacterium]